MLDLNSKDFSFKTERQIEAYSKFFLGATPIDSKLELKTTAEIKSYNDMREVFIKAQLGYLRNISLEKPNVNKIDGQYIKICKETHKKPLSSLGATVSSSRFNYKEIPIWNNKAIYFGRTKLCCEIEKFHLNYQREQIRKRFDESYTLQDGEIKFPPHLTKTYEISLDNILVLTSKPSMDAIGITQGAFMNEWYDINEEYEIPTSSQILGAIVRAKGYKGILYKSVRYQIDSNLVIFEENTGELDFKEVESQPYHPSSEIIDVK